MVAADGVTTGGPETGVRRDGRRTHVRTGGAVAVAVGVVALTPWTLSAAHPADDAGPTRAPVHSIELPDLSPVEEDKGPARLPRQVRASSSSSVAPSDTSSVDPVTDDTAIGTVSSTGDGTSPPPTLPAELDPVTGLVGLDAHDHPWDEQPPPLVDLGALVDPPGPG
jgi:hypothetical protein